MVGKTFNKRFGTVAIEKGYITKEELIQAMKLQIESDLDGTEPKLIGAILHDLNYMTSQQIDKVLESLSNPYECPSCHVMIRICPNCGANMR